MKLNSFTLLLCAGLSAGLLPVNGQVQYHATRIGYGAWSSGMNNHGDIVYTMGSAGAPGETVHYVISGATHEVPNPQGTEFMWAASISDERKIAGYFGNYGEPAGYVGFSYDHTSSTFEYFDLDSLEYPVVNGAGWIQVFELTLKRVIRDGVSYPRTGWRVNDVGQILVTPGRDEEVFSLQLEDVLTGAVLGSWTIPNDRPYSKGGWFLDNLGRITLIAADDHMYRKNLLSLDASLEVFDLSRPDTFWVVTDVNDVGWAVGNQYSETSTAYLYIDGVPYDLNALTVGTEGIHFFDATLINEGGQLLVYGRRVNEPFESVLYRLDPIAPVPEPATYGIIAALALLATAALRGHTRTSPAIPKGARGAEKCL